jgi:pimeloyl-ACP methyl ester carboxylesterase
MKVIKGDIQMERFSIPYRIYGDAKPTIVCISGAKQTMAAWRSFVSHFVSDYSVVVFDLPGQGRAKILTGSPAVSFEEQQQVLLDIIQATRRKDTVTLAGASWGTIVSAAVAAKHPKLIDKLILGSFGVRPNQNILDVISHGKQLFETGRSDEIAPFMIKSFGQFIPEIQKKQMLEQFSSMSREEFLSFHAHCGFVEQALHLEELIDLSNIAAKTLIVNGEYDTILDNTDIQDISKRIPNCVFKLIPKAGHFLHWERPEILNTYSDFLSA